jgi:hypothetical protein
MRLGIMFLLCLAGCGSSSRTSTGRSAHETDSVIGQSQLPGAEGVEKAMGASDSLRARTARQDSIGASQ